MKSIKVLLISIITIYLSSSVHAELGYAVGKVDKDVNVAKVQAMLAELCYKPGIVDGAWGKKTETAVRAFFAKHYRKYDGNFDVEDANFILSAGASAKSFGSANVKKCLVVYSDRIGDNSKNTTTGKPYTNVSVNNGPWSGPMMEVSENILIYGPTPGRYSSFLKDTGRQRGGPQHFTGDFNNDGYVDFIYGGAVDDGKYNLIYSNRKNINNATDIDDNDPLKQMYSCGKMACITPNMMPELFLGTTNGTWERSSYLLIDKRKNAGIRGAKVHVADFNGDGVQDFWFNDDKADESGQVSSNQVRWSGFRDSYYLSQPNGTWLESSDTHLNKVVNNFSHAGQAGDINGDGWIDMLSGTSGKHVDCWINIGDGVMKYRKCVDGAASFLIDLADFDGDGDLDMYTIQQENSNQPGRPKISCNDGNGWFRVCKDMSVFTDGDYDWVGVGGVRSWDFDNDGDQDMIQMRFRNLYVGVAMEIKENLGNMNFNSELTVLMSGPTKEEFAKLKTEANRWNKYFQLQLHDVNDDGLMDVIFYDGKSGLYDNTIWLNKGNLQFELIKKNDKNNPMKQIRVSQTNYKETASAEILKIVEN